MQILFICIIILSTFCLSSAIPSGSGHKSVLFPHKSNIFRKPSVNMASATKDPVIIATEENKDTSMSSSSSSLKRSLLKMSLGLWGVLQVISVLANAIKRLYPIAIQPIIQKDITPVHWAMYIVWALYMAYAEGYKAFQLKFAPMVVERAFNLIDNPSIINYFLAGPYSMGMFNASRKRMIVSWAVTVGVFTLVKLVKMLPYPYRSIVDAGVVVGLSYGTLAILALTVKVMLGGVIEPETEGKPLSNDAKIQ